MGGPTSGAWPDDRPRAGSPVTCPRCGRRSVPAGGPFCPFCGCRLTSLRWTAHPPPSPTPTAPPRVRTPYTGPPRYRFLPRWGFPARAWTPPESGLPAPGGPLRASRSILTTVVPLLRVAAVVALIAAGAEAWRYLLLLDSRVEALAPAVVATSDALVTAAGTVAPVVALLAGVGVVLWTVRASAAAADRAGVRPARSARMIVAGWLLPVVNLSVPGSVFAEIEHTALDGPAAARPRPSRLLAVWWVLWVAGLGLAAVVLVWSFRTGVQARADGVVLHAVLDVVAAVTALVTSTLLIRLTELLGPDRPGHREILVAVGAPGPVGP